MINLLYFKGKNISTMLNYIDKKYKIFFIKFFEIDDNNLYY